MANDDVIDRIAYTPSGESTRTLRSDMNGDGVVNKDDYDGVIQQLKGTVIGDPAYVVEADLDRDGKITSDDYDVCIADDGQKSSGGVGEAGLFSAGVRNSLGYCGYVYNEDTGLYTVRFRTYSTTLGRWLTRDPLGYVDGPNIYQYVRSRPLARVDAFGLDDYDVGPPSKPCDIKWDDAYKQDPNFSPGWGDHWQWNKFRLFTLGCEATGYLNDGTRAYRRYRDASGKDLEVEYERAYREDEGIQKAVDDEVAAAICQAISLAKKNGNCKQSLWLRSKASRLAESKTDNWRKALGGHRIWGQGTLKYDPSTGTWTIKLEVET